MSGFLYASEYKNYRIICAELGPWHSSELYVTGTKTADLFVEKVVFHNIRSLVKVAYF